MKYFIPSLFLLTILLTGCSESNQDTPLPPGLNAAISHSVNPRDLLTLSTPDKKPLFLGNFESTSPEITVNLLNRTAAKIEIPQWRSSCPCIEIVSAPETIAKNDTAPLILRLHVENYDGRVVKAIPITCRADGKSATVFLRLEFQAGPPPETPREPTPQNHDIHYLNYSGGSMQDKQYQAASAWIFSGAECAVCDEVKQTVFPRAFPGGTQIVHVNLDRKEGLLLLLDLEKKLGLAASGDAPVLFWQNQLFYGKKSIEEKLCGEK